MTKNKMKAVVANAYGSADVLEYTTVNKPEAKPNEVLVRVINSAATTADTMMRSGTPWFGRLFIGLRKPKQGIPGTGFAGEIVEVGSDVQSFKIGDRVFGETKFGFKANAEFIAIGENEVILPLADEIKFSEAANFCDGHLTSYTFLTDVIKLKKGDQILINGASGALGTAAIQIAKYIGAEVTAVSSGKNEGLVKSLGADNFINYHEKDFTQTNNQYDYIFDTVGKSSFEKSRKILKINGAYLSPVLNLNLLKHQICSRFFGKRRALFAAVGTYNNADIVMNLLHLMDIFKEGKLKTIIDRQFPLAKLAEAHHYIDSGHKKGNVVIYHHS